MKRVYVVSSRWCNNIIKKSKECAAQAGYREQEDKVIRMTGVQTGRE